MTRLRLVPPNVPRGEWSTRLGVVIAFVVMFTVAALVVIGAASLLLWALDAGLGVEL